MWRLWPTNHRHTYRLPWPCFHHLLLLFIFWIQSLFIVSLTIVKILYELIIYQVWIARSEVGCWTSRSMGFGPVRFGPQKGQAAQRLSRDRPDDLTWRVHSKGGRAAAVPSRRVLVLYTGQVAASASLTGSIFACNSYLQGRASLVLSVVSQALISRAR